MNSDYSRRIAVIVIPALLFLYVLPVFVISGAVAVGKLNGETSIGKWFISLLVSPDAAFNLYHKVLLPITAGVTVATMWEKGNAAWTIGVVIGLVLSITLSIWLQVLFGVQSFQDELYQSAGNPKVTTAEQFFSLASSFMGRFQENLAIYLLVLLGIQAIPQSSKG